MSYLRVGSTIGGSPILSKNDMLILMEQYVDYNDLESEITNKIVQELGFDPTKIISQKALTEALEQKIDVTALQEILDSKVSKSDILQEIGSSVTCTMSQDAITRALSTKLGASDIVQNTGNSDNKVMSQEAITTSLASKLDTSALTQETGSSPTRVMSQQAVAIAVAQLGGGTLADSVGMDSTKIMTQRAITEELEKRVEISDIAHETGRSKIKVMSQEGITDILNKFTEDLALNVVQSMGNSDKDVMSQRAITENIKDYMSTRTVVHDANEITVDVLTGNTAQRIPEGFIVTGINYDSSTRAVRSLLCHKLRLS